MDPLLQMAAIVSARERNSYAHSALPDAPVVAETAPKAARSRAVVAALLHRVADIVAPRTSQTEARHTLAAGRGSALIRWDESPCRPSPTTSA
jgi:hypothetical protein